MIHNFENVGLDASAFHDRQQLEWIEPPADGKKGKRAKSFSQDSPLTRVAFLTHMAHSWWKDIGETYDMDSTVAAGAHGRRVGRLPDLHPRLRTGLPLGHLPLVPQRCGELRRPDPPRHRPPGAAAGAVLEHACSPAAPSATPTGTPRTA